MVKVPAGCGSSMMVESDFDGSSIIVVSVFSASLPSGLGLVGSGFSSGFAGVVGLFRSGFPGRGIYLSVFSLFFTIDVFIEEKTIDKLFFSNYGNLIFKFCRYIFPECMENNPV